MFKLTLRTLLARKVRLAMSTLAIVLGIGFLAGVLIFSNGLSSTFDGIVKGSTPDALVRPADAESFQTVAASTSSTVSPQDVAALTALPEVEAADGNVDGTGMFLLDPDGKLVGGQGAPTIAFNYTDTLNLLGEPALQLVDGAWPTKPKDVVLDAGAAERAGYEVGDKVRAIAPAGNSAANAQRTFTLTGTAEFNGGGTAGAILMVFSTQGAQRLFLDGNDVFTSVSLSAGSGVTQSQLVDAAASVAPDGFTAVTGDDVVEESQDAIGQFLDVISTFLIVFAVIAILVGGFIIANTFTILVAQRVRELALLRALGANKVQIRRSVLLEAALMALLGSTAGILVGLGLARALAALFRSFGLDINANTLALTPTTVVLAYLVGLGVTMISAYLPSRRASRIAPVAAMRSDVASPGEASLRRRALVGAVVIAVGAGLAVVGLRGGPGNDAIWIGAAAILWILTAAVLSPVLGHPLLVACRVVFSRLFGTTGRLAGENALRNPRRTGATAAALMIGLALVSAVGTLASSLSATSDDLVDQQFAPDFIVQSASFADFPTGIADDMAKVDGVDLLSADQYTGALIDGEPVFVGGLGPGFSEIYTLEMDSGTQQMTGHQTIISTDAATEYGVRLGDDLTLTAPGNKSTTVTVVGTFEQSPVAGPVNVPRSVLRDLGVKPSDTVLSINAESGADLTTVQDDLESVIADVPIVSVLDKEQFAESIQGQINQLLYMIYGLLALAIVIAVVGIVNTLGLSVIERTREIGLLRAVGLSRGRLRWMVTLESVTISVMGAVLGMAIGLVIGVLLRQSLSEDLTVLSLPLTSLVMFLGISVLFGVLAAVVPAIRASRLKVLDAIATE